MGRTKRTGYIGNNFGANVTPSKTAFLFVYTYVVRSECTPFLLGPAL